MFTIALNLILAIEVVILLPGWTATIEVKHLKYSDRLVSLRSVANFLFVLSDRLFTSYTSLIINNLVSPLLAKSAECDRSE